MSSIFDTTTTLLELSTTVGEGERKLAARMLAQAARKEPDLVRRRALRAIVELVDGRTYHDGLTARVRAELAKGPGWPREIASRLDTADTRRVANALRDLRVRGAAQRDGNARYYLVGVLRGKHLEKHPWAGRAVLPKRAP